MQCHVTRCLTPRANRLDIENVNNTHRQTDRQTDREKERGTGTVIGDSYVANLSVLPWDDIADPF